MVRQVRPSFATLVLAIVLLLPNHTLPQTTLVIRNQSGVVVSGLNISTTSGDCVQIINSTDVTIQASQIGPCGTNGTASNSRGIFVKGGGGINIYDSYIHVENQASVCGDTHDGIFITGTDGRVNVQGNVIAYNEQNVRVSDVSNVHIVGNFVLNPKGALICSNPDNLPGHSIQA